MQQKRLLPFVHEGTEDSTRRLPFGVGETVWLERWKHENEQHAVLEHLAGGIPLDQRMVQLVANVVQWMGTNVGQCFVTRCQRVIDQSHTATRAIEGPMCSDFERKQVAAAVIQRIAINKVFGRMGGITIQQGTREAVEKVAAIVGNRAFDIEN